MKVEAILFDMDGTLINSEPMHTKTIQGVVKERLNEEVSDEKIEKYVGLDYEHKLMKIFDGKDDINYKELDKIVTEKSLENSHLIEKIPGAEEVIREMKENFKIALVTGSSREQAETFLEIVDFKKYFEVIVTASDVENNKPNPDSYLLGAKKLAVDIENCVVLEDSEPGIRAAKSAGTFCIAIRHDHNKHLNFSKADKIVDGINKIDLELIKSLQ
jgi:HAD superfamily hydrolase (TIGR01509 family)